MILLLVFSFLSGLVTILAPCIWPLLPIILASSSVSNNGHQRPLGISLGIILSFAFFTLTISFLVKLFHFDPNILRTVAVVVIGFLGLSMLIPNLSNSLETLLSRWTSNFQVRGQAESGSGFKGGFVTGLALGVVWTPCAGPILASIATLAATGQANLSVVLITLAYVLGVGIPLFLFAYGGQQIFSKTKFISAHTQKVQQFFGIVMLLTALAIFTNYDQVIQLKLLNTFPNINGSLSVIESNPIVKQQLDMLKGAANQNSNTPDFIGITNWLNTDKPLSLNDLRGKVILVDFWTYTCINCIRSLPHVTAWYDKYKDMNFVVIGVHTPEFEFEKNTANVEAAIKQYGIHYPVAQDNNYATWNNYNNQYWPAEYLIDAKGIIRHTHFGEGSYDETEKVIQSLIKETGVNPGTTIVNISDQNPKTALSPETYLGSSRMQYYFPSGNLVNGKKNFNLSPSPAEDTFSLGGEWTINDENAVAGANAVLNYNFFADKVFLVLRPATAGNQAKINVFIDGKPNGTIVVDSDRLYNLVDLKGNPGRHILQLEFLNSGVEVYAFTFG